MYNISFPKGDKMRNIFSFIHLQNRYIPALLIIAIFTTLGFINLNQIMTSIENDGKIINISGRQRMLSQKLVLLSQNYLDEKNENTKTLLIKNINLMKSSHQYLLDNISFLIEAKVDTQIKNYLNNIEKIIKTKNLKLLNNLRKESHTLLIELDKIVKNFEKYHENKIYDLKSKGILIYLLILIILVIEVILIFYPTSKKIKENRLSLENAVKEKTKELQKSLDIISEYVIISKTDLKGIITYASKAFCEICGYSEKELLGKPHNIIRHPDMPKEAFKDMWETIKKGNAWKGEVKNKKKNGKYYWVNANISPDYDKKGNIIGYTGIRYDITAKKELEKLNLNLEEKVALEVKNNREKDKQLFQQAKTLQLNEMLGNIAHHWRQPLSLISTCVSGLVIQKELEQLSDEELKESLHLLIKTTEELSQTITDFSECLKIDSQKVYFNICKHMDKIISIIKPSYNDNHIKFIKEYKDKNIQLFSYPNELSQAVLNIFNNSKDAFQKNLISKPYICIRLQKDKDFVIITIEDNAGGIPKEIVPKIFDPYFTTKHQSKGIGLGLSITHNIITKLEGSINVENDLDKTRFKIKLPLYNK